MIFKKPKQLLGTKNLSSSTFNSGTEYIIPIYYKLDPSIFYVRKLSYRK